MKSILFHTCVRSRLVYCVLYIGVIFSHGCGLEKRNKGASSTLNPSIVQLVKDFQKEYSSSSEDRGVVEIAIKTSDHYPYHIEYDWYVIYLTRLEGYGSKNEIINSIIKNAPSNFTYINNALILIYSDSDYYIKKGDDYLNSLRKELQINITDFHQEGIPPNYTPKIYRYEHCNGIIEKSISNVFPPEVIPFCYQ